MEKTVKVMFDELYEKWGKKFDFKYCQNPFKVDEEHKVLIVGSCTFTDVNDFVRISLHPREDDEDKQVVFSSNSMGKEMVWGMTLNMRTLYKDVAECMLDCMDFIADVFETTKKSGYEIM